MRVTRREALGLIGLTACSALAACAGADDGPSEADTDGGALGPGAGHVPDQDGGSSQEGDAADGQNPTTCAPTRRDAEGPFYAPGAPSRMMLAGPEEPGERIRLDGVVVGPDCVTPIAGALLDVWQADKDGNYHDATKTAYRLRGTVQSDAEGRFHIETIRPGHYENGPGNWRPAHIHFTVSAPGHRSVTTQLYFAGDPYLAPNDGCPGCGSDDAARIVELTENGDFLAGSWRVVLAHA